MWNNWDLANAFPLLYYFSGPLYHFLDVLAAFILPFEALFVYRRYQYKIKWPLFEFCNNFRSEINVIFVKPKLKRFLTTLEIPGPLPRTRVVFARRLITTEDTLTVFCRGTFSFFRRPPHRSKCYFTASFPGCYSRFSIPNHELLKRFSPAALVE
jgi:hypothetical protein